MQNDPNVIEKAKRQIMKYRIGTAITFIIMVICSFVTMYGLMSLSYTLAVIFSCLVGFTLAWPLPRIIRNKFILNVIWKDLDAETFLAIVQQGKIDTYLADYQLYGELFCGRYENVVSICKAKMSDSKIARRHRGMYLVYLAHVYFHIGDDENLHCVLDQYDFFLATEKAWTRSGYLKKYKNMTFYENYLKRDIKACTELMNRPANTRLDNYIDTFKRARLALIQGNADEARGYYEALAKEVPQLCYGKLSEEALAKMEEQTSDQVTKLMDISGDPSPVSTYNPRSAKVRIIICLAILAVFLLYAVVSDIGAWVDKKAYEEFAEEVRLLVEEDHDNVTVLDLFVLANEDEIVDSMFICKTDTQLILGSIYAYEGETEYHYDEVYIYPLSAETPSWLNWFVFSATTSDYRVAGNIYSDKASVPDEYYYLFVFEIDGKKMYLVITEIIPQSAPLEAEEITL